MCRIPCLPTPIEAGRLAAEAGRISKLVEDEGLSKLPAISDVNVVVGVAPKAFAAT